jgi:hypothetical protein
LRLVVSSVGFFMFLHRKCCDDVHSWHDLLFFIAKSNRHGVTMKIIMTDGVVIVLQYVLAGTVPYRANILIVIVSVNSVLVDRVECLLRRRRRQALPNVVETAFLHRLPRPSARYSINEWKHFVPSSPCSIVDTPIPVA